MDLGVRGADVAGHLDAGAVTELYVEEGDIGPGDRDPRHGLRHAADMGGLAGHPDLAPVHREEPEDGLGELRAPRAHEPVETDDLALVEGNRHGVDGAEAPEHFDKVLGFDRGGPAARGKGVRRHGGGFERFQLLMAGGPYTMCVRKEGPP